MIQADFTEHGYARGALLGPTYGAGNSRSHPFSPLLPQRIDGSQAFLRFEVPIGPAIAGRQILHRRADAVDRAFEAPPARPAGERSVGANEREMPAPTIGQLLASRNNAGLNQRPEGDTGC